MADRYIPRRSDGSWRARIHPAKFWAKPQLQLLLQPVTVVNEKRTSHDIAIHAVFGFVGQPEAPDRDRFKEIVRDLDALKELVSDGGTSTNGLPLGVHSGLKAKTPKLREEVEAFLEKHLHPRLLSAMEIMGLDGPEPWIFVALGKFPPTADRFGPILFWNSATQPVDVVID